MLNLSPDDYPHSVQNIKIKTSSVNAMSSKLQELTQLGSNSFRLDTQIEQFVA